MLRGPGRLVWVPARGRLTIDTPFDDHVKRATRQTAARRNRYVCERADAVLIAHARPGGRTEALARELIAAGKPVYTIDHPANANLLALGAGVYQTCQVLRPPPKKT